MSFKIISNLIAKGKSIFPPLKEVLSEDGVGSYSRYTGFLIVLATLAWITFLVVKNHAFPDMEGPTFFMAGGQAQYAINQAKRVMAAAKDNPTSANNPPQVLPVSDDPKQPEKPDRPGGSDNASSSS